VDTQLVGDQQVGNLLLVFLNSAREVLSTAKARVIAQALLALDLVNRKPQLSEHLRLDK
jgi:hypothetical protein